MNEDLKRELGIPRVSEPRKNKGTERPNPRNRNLDADHRKFLAVMFGIFLVLFLAMVFFNHLEFDVGGGL